MQIAPIPQDKRKLSKPFRASSLPLRICKYLTPFNTNTIENLDIKCLSVNTRGLQNASPFSDGSTTKMYTSHFFKKRTVRNLMLTQWSAECGGKVFFSHGTMHSKGVMILISPKLDYKVEKCILDNNGRFIILDVTLDDSHIILVNIYAPTDLNQPVKFFKLVQHHLQDFSEEIVIIGGDFNCSLSDKDKKGGNPITKKASVIKEIDHIIPKKDKDKSLLENLQPTLLLDVAYKILTKIIAKRMASLTQNYQSQPNRLCKRLFYRQELIRLIQDVMFLKKHANTPGIAIVLHFRKAFETIEWNYLLSTLKLFNSRPDIQRWIEVIYHKVSSCILNNGHASTFPTPSSFCNWY